MFFVFDSFLNEKERFELLCMAYSATEKQWTDESNPKGGIWETNRLPIVSPILDDINLRIASFFSNYSQIYRITAIQRFTQGAYMAEHSDNKSGVTDFGCVVYLNDNFEGGELIYPNLNKSLKPTAGNLVIHDSDEPHMVKTITKGVRYMLTTFVLGTESVRSSLTHDS